MQVQISAAEEDPMVLGCVAAQLMAKVMVERMLEEAAEPGRVSKSSFKLSSCLLVKPWAMVMNDRPMERIV